MVCMSAIRYSKGYRRKYLGCDAYNLATKAKIVERGLK